eukprot:723584-Amphidinium_carterae.1
MLRMATEIMEDSRDESDTHVHAAYGTPLFESRFLSARFPRNHHVYSDSTGWAYENAESKIGPSSASTKELEAGQP